MKLSDLEIGDVVKFTNYIEEFESGFEAGMIAKIVQKTITSDDIVELYFDFSEFEIYNKSLMTANYYDTNRRPTLRWDETNYYPKNKIESIYFDISIKTMPFEIFTPEMKSPQKILIVAP